MTNERLQYLLDQQHTGNISELEAAELDSWYSQTEARENLTARLSENAAGALEVRLLSRINHEIDNTENRLENLEPSKKLWEPARLYRIAAVFLGLLVVGAGLYIYDPFAAKQVSEVTKYGEIRTVHLPDGSEVILNGNSAITYAGDWKNDDTREVRLKGEAYFKVVHTSDNRKFRVSTDEHFSVDVLGTQFSVNSRESGTRVVLNEGKVQCNLGKEQGDALILKPGELIEFDTKPSKYIRKSVEADQYSAWKDRKLILKNTTFREISDMLTETYGLRITTENPDLLGREVSGSVPLDNVETLLEGLAEACDLNVRREGENVSFAPRKR
ncbi:FecR family protein [Dyadobacter bucti]|uniref:FecR family protein n=1 Tax=Dyadobacter bucti TaxID=2572203 RepID=UPI003F712206